MGLSVMLNNRVVVEASSQQSIVDLHQAVADKLNVRPEDFYFTQNGRKVATHTTDELDMEATIQTIFRLIGGKGGFGSMLRAIGAQIEKTTNRDACRDLSGRRLRDINEEKRLKAWLEKQQDKESDQYARKKKKLERLLTQPRHDFKDEQYEQARSELTANVDEAVEEGLKKAAAVAAAVSSGSFAGQKRKAGDAAAAKGAKRHLWIAADLSSGSDEDDSTDDEGATGRQTEKEAVCAEA